MRGIPVGVALVAAGLYFIALGAAPFLDPPEGFHAAIAQRMLAGGDWLTPGANGIRYFDKPPLTYWLMSGAFAAGGATPFAARFWPAAAAVACAAVTARLGVRLGGPRLGLLAGLMVVANLGIFLYGRMVKPDLLFVLCIVLAFAGFATAYLGISRRGLVLFYAALGLAAMAKDLLGAVGPLALVAVFLWLTGERPLAKWFPWWGPLLLLGVAAPWYLAVELRNPGFLWYTIVDNHILNVARQRVFPDEDVPLGPLEFLLVTALAFLPWTLAVPRGIVRALRRPWPDATARLWALLALWAIVVIGLFAVSPFRLPHYGLPAFPALALLAAKVWDEALAQVPGAARPRTLLVPLAVLFALGGAAAAAAWLEILPIPDRAMTTLDVASRNLAASGQPLPASPAAAWAPIVGSVALVLLAAAGLLAFAAWRQRLAPGTGLALAAMVAFLPLAGQGVTQFARGRAAEPVTQLLARLARPGDLVVHEGAVENSGSILLVLRDPLRIVDGHQSNLAFGATFPEARDLFWDAPRLGAEWARPGRHYLISVVRPERSVVRALPPGTVHLLASAGGRWLYSSRPE